jgi:3-oxoacyl-[acyl-carrier protein] reductase
MKERRWGRVIMMASPLASAPLPDMAPYCASKAAIVNLAVSLAKELAGTGIAANAVSPGPILTAGLEQFLRKLGAKRGWPADGTELERRRSHRPGRGRCRPGRLPRQSLRRLHQWGQPARGWR